MVRLWDIKKTPLVFLGECILGRRHQWLPWNRRVEGYIRNQGVTIFSQSLNRVPPRTQFSVITHNNKYPPHLAPRQVWVIIFPLTLFQSPTLSHTNSFLPIRVNDLISEFVYLAIIIHDLLGKSFSWLLISYCSWYWKIWCHETKWPLWFLFTLNLSSDF